VGCFSLSVDKQLPMLQRSILPPFSVSSIPGTVAMPKNGDILCRQLRMIELTPPRTFLPKYVPMF